MCCRKVESRTTKWKVIFVCSYQVLTSVQQLWAKQARRVFRFRPGPEYIIFSLHWWWIRRSAFLQSFRDSERWHMKWLCWKNIKSFHHNSFCLSSENREANKGSVEWVDIKGDACFCFQYKSGISISSILWRFGLWVHTNGFCVMLFCISLVTRKCRSRHDNYLPVERISKHHLFVRPWFMPDLSFVSDMSQHFDMKEWWKFHDLSNDDTTCDL